MDKNALNMDKNALKKQIICWISDNYDFDDEILLADGLESAFVGVGTNNNNKMCAIYDVDECINSLIKDGLTCTEACEYFDYNIESAYVGENAPIFIYRFNRK